MRLFTPFAGRMSAIVTSPAVPAVRSAERHRARRRLPCVLAHATNHTAVSGVSTTRRDALLMLAAAAPVALLAQRADAVQGLVAGRLPGLSKTADEEGFFTYTRPEGKSGGHGVGWSEIPPYSFRVAPGWDEVPTSIADLGGAEVDLRFQKEDEGDVAVVVAPVLRFRDVGFNADVRLQDLVTSEQLISGFAPELIGQPLQEGDVLSSETIEKKSGAGKLMYYQYELKTSKVAHLLVIATAYKNRLYICQASANGRLWRKGEKNMRKTVDSFTVITA